MYPCMSKKERSNVSYTADTPACKKGVVGDGRDRLRVDSDSGTVVVR